MKWHEPPFLLKEIKLEVTHACRLRCVHCSSVAGATCTREMSLESCRRTLGEAADMGVEKVALSGGEPLLWDSLVDAVGFAAGRDMRVCLYTSGNAPNACSILKCLKMSGLARVMFSLFSADPASHDAVTKVVGSYSATLSAVRNCVNLGLPSELHFVPFASNFEELRPIAEMGRRLGVEQVSVLRLVPQGRAAKGPDMQLSAAQNRALRRAICGLCQEGHHIRTGSPYNFLMLSKNPQCCSGIDRLTIGPDLRIFPCDAFKHIPPERLGVSPDYSCLTQHSLAECWEKSPYLAEIRRYLTTPFAEECRRCPSLEKCLSGCMAQKFHAYGALVKCPDPMCLMAKAVQCMA